jgi:mono/diheme cytochrome c family protein
VSETMRSGRVWSRCLGFCLAALVVGCTPLDDVMVSIFGRSMRDQASFDPYEAPLGAPEGSIPFAAGNFPAAPGEVNVGQPEPLADPPPPFTQTDVLDESPVVMNLVNPVPSTEASLDRGEELFLRFCAPCHGPAADGRGYIVGAPGYPPFPLNTDRVRNFPDGYIYGMMRVGRGVMPSYGDRISHFDRWNVVNYLRVLQGVRSAPSQGVSASGQSPTPGQDRPLPDESEGRTDSSGGSFPERN